ncbi:MULTISPECIES: hypothetical protein [unclassified Bradyrhizobium]|uniref:hypothetical protein n=1 Tax=unclassified Bradyrhizobium TaxID=2631580 RepID=UPI000418E903|nr:MULTISPECIES: hypothetical protein [unclassified Bradyrhizobium]MCP3460147.1 hypothetical protein [Bradyrhizobium sp. CCGUVB23]
MTVRKTHAAALALTALVVGTVAFAVAPVAATAHPIAGARVAPTRPAAHAYQTRETPAPHVQMPHPSDHPDGTFPFIWLG